MSEHPRAMLRRLEQRARRRFGQHFLVRDDIVDRMVQGARVAPGERVLEIGPGLGILTRALLRAGASVTAIELDRDLAAFLGEELPTVHLVQGDALHVDLAELLGADCYKVVANLPYNVGTHLLLRLLEQRAVLRVVAVMLQREVADRLMALPRTKAYGALTVRVQVRAAVRPMLQVPPDAFHPPPKVRSSVLHLDLHPEPDFGLAGEEVFDKVVRAGFSHRRKTLTNSLTPLWGRAAALAALHASGIHAAARAEEIDVDGYRRLAAALGPAPATAE